MIILAISPTDLKAVPLAGITAIGGMDCSGIKVDGLKAKGEYCVLSTSPTGVEILNLHGKKSQTQTLHAFERAQIMDLSVICLEESSSTDSRSALPELKKLEALLRDTQSGQDIPSVMKSVLDLLTEGTQTEKGLVVYKKDNTPGAFEIACAKGVSESEPWLSEGFVLETLKSAEPVQIQNIIGSRFQNNQSLNASGFLSVFSFPLLHEGISVGILMAGSKRPHSGLSEDQLVFGKILAHIAAGLVATLLKQQALQSQVEAMRTLSRAQTGPFVSKSPAMEKMSDMARRVASTDLSVVIQGESGVGKEVLARWIHNSSTQAKGPFVAINCGAIPEGLIESQLFGHQKGAFTGAVSDAVGKFVQANHGTVFLDEVADLPLTTQVKLLRVLQEKIVEPVGSTRSTQVQVRILCASHKNLRKLVAEGKFRQDLYYRLADVELEIPPLRQRIDDIAIITMRYFAETGCQKRLSKAALDWLRKQQWPGNVRELLSTLRRAVALSADPEIQTQDFMMGGQSNQEDTNWLGGPDLETARDLFVYTKVQRALQLTSGHRGQTAELLGVTTRTLFRYLDEMKSKGIDVTNLSVDRKDVSL